MTRIGYNGPNKCPVCDCTMLSWFHLEDHYYELQQRVLNPDDPAIKALHAHGCIVRREISHLVLPPPT